MLPTVAEEKIQLEVIFSSDLMSFLHVWLLCCYFAVRSFMSDCQTQCVTQAGVEVDLFFSLLVLALTSALLPWRK